MQVTVDMNEWCQRRGRPPVYKTRHNALKLVVARWAEHYEGHRPGDDAA